MNAPEPDHPRAMSLSTEFRIIDRIAFSKLVFAIFAVAVAAELLAGWLGLFRANLLQLDYDEGEYWSLSSQILSGQTMEVGRRTMLYPLLLAGVRSFSNNIWFAQSVIAILGATAAPLLAILVRKIARSKTAGALAGLGLALWPPQVFYGASLYSETVALPVFLLFLTLLPLDQAGSRSGWWKWALAGVALGVTAHIRPMYQLFLGLLPLIIWFDVRNVPAAAARFLLVLSGFALVVLPWSFYVSELLGNPTLLTANGGETLAGGFNPTLIERGERHLVFPKRTTWDGPGKWIASSETGYLSASEQKLLSYSEQDRLLRARTIAWMQGNPTDAAYLAFRKLTYMWGVYPFMYNGWRQAIFGNLPTILLTLFFLVAVASQRSVRRWGARLYLMPLFVSGIALISWGSWRFRLPSDAAMIGVMAMLIAARFREFPDNIYGWRRARA